ncbi:MAG: GTPase Era [Peptostreptococcaceae bacterium]|nr:GTPase Era [Peptostreptococcaceae bacterium]
MFKSGFVSIVGRPNVGKSTLLNSLIEDKVAIMSDKPQTTRNLIRGIYNDEEAQIVFSDTPGIQSPRNKLGRYMEKTSVRSLSDTDVILFVVDDSNFIGRKDKDIIERLKNRKEPVLLIINKVDLMDHEELIKRIVMYDELQIFKEIIPVSALKNKNKDRIIKVLKNYLPEGPKFFSEDITTDQPTKVLISEIIREKILHYTEEEIPHGVMVEIERLKEKKNDLIDIGALIYVERENHKKIIIGKGGRKIKGIGMAARKELEERFEARVNLELWVKTKENWRDNESFIKNFGFDDREKV